MKKSVFIGGIVAVVAIVAIIITVFTVLGNSSEEQIMLYEGEDYAAQFYMAEKETIFFRVTNNLDEPIFVKVDNLTSNGKEVNLKGYSGFDYIEHEMERGSTENWTNFDDTFNVISLTEYVGNLGTTVVDFGMLGDGQVYNLSKEEVKGTLNLYTLNAENGEYTLLEAIDFTIPAEYDGQMF